MEHNQSQADTDGLFVEGITQHEKFIGSGRFGKVFEVKYQGTTCAAKEIQAGGTDLGDSETESLRDQFIKQCHKYSVLRHPNIVQFYGVCNTMISTQPSLQSEGEDDDEAKAREDNTKTPQIISFVILTELMASNLTSLLEKHESIPLHIKLSMLHDVSLGLNYLHLQTPVIAHGRLYSNNILLSTHLVAKIGDFGFLQLAKSSSDLPSPGIADFVPLKYEDNDPLTDVFSYGGVLIHTMTLQWPTPVNNEVSTTPLEIDRRKKYLEKLSGELKLLAISCLEDDPKSRPTAAELVESIKKVKNERKSPFADMNPITWLAEVDTLSSKLEDSLLELNEAYELLTEHEELIDQLQVSYCLYT